MTSRSTLARRQLELLGRMARLEPTPWIFGGYAEDALLAGRITRHHGDIDWLLPRSELPRKLEQAAELGFASFETWGESAPGEPFYLAAWSGDVLLELGIVDEEPCGHALRVHRLLFEVDGREPPAGYRLLLPPDTFSHPAVELEGIAIQPVSPLALYQFRVGIASVGSFGPLSERHCATSSALRQRLLADHQASALVPRIEPLRKEALAVAG